MSKRVKVDPQTWAPTDPAWRLDDMFKRLGRDDDSERTRMWHLDGTRWYEAPIPSRWHRCTPQTYGFTDWFTVVNRCACGGAQMLGSGPWLGRNSRHIEPAA